MTVPTRKAFATFGSVNRANPTGTAFIAQIIVTYYITNADGTDGGGGAFGVNATTSETSSSIRKQVEDIIQGGDSSLDVVMFP
jgi:hypothetical protein